MTDKVYTYRRYADTLVELGRGADALKVYERLRALVFTESVRNRSPLPIDTEQITRRRELEQHAAELNRAHLAAHDANQRSFVDQRRDRVRDDIDRLDNEMSLEQAPAESSTKWKSVLQA